MNLCQKLRTSLGVLFITLFVMATPAYAAGGGALIMSLGLLLGDIDGLRPGDSVVITSHQHQLAGFRRFKPGSGAVPTSVAVTPQSRNPNGARDSIHEDGRVADPIVSPLGFRAHVHDDPHRVPGFATIR